MAVSSFRREPCEHVHVLPSSTWLAQKGWTGLVSQLTLMGDRINSPAFARCLDRRKLPGPCSALPA